MTDKDFSYKFCKDNQLLPEVSSDSILIFHTDDCDINAIAHIQVTVKTPSLSWRAAPGFFFKWKGNTRLEYNLSVLNQDYHPENRGKQYIAMCQNITDWLAQIRPLSRVEWNAIIQMMISDFLSFVEVSPRQFLSSRLRTNQR